MKIVTDKEILACAEEILRNTPGSLKEMLERFVRFYHNGGVAICSGDGFCTDESEDDYEGDFDDDYDGEDDAQYWNNKLYSVFYEICRDGYDVKGFYLFDVPHPNAFCFANIAKREAFNVYTYDTQLGYVGDDSCEHFSESIQEAIEKYAADTWRFC